MAQFTITECNQHECETFRYVMDLTQEQYQLIEQSFKQYPDSNMSIDKTSYSKDDIVALNRVIRNSYMPHIAVYEFREPLEQLIRENDEYVDMDDDYDAEERESFKQRFLVDEVFYKANMLQRL